ncbi:hypothetical protein Chor_014832 [Crotalus horridus]
MTKQQMYDTFIGSPLPTLPKNELLSLQRLKYFLQNFLSLSPNVRLPEESHPYIDVHLKILILGTVSLGEGRLFEGWTPGSCGAFTSKLCQASRCVDLRLARSH